MRILVSIGSLALASAMMLCGAAIDGVWKTGYKSKDGKTSESAFHFQSNGEKLTGKIVGKSGEIPIKDGVVKGNDVSFSITRKFGDRDVTFKYAGKVNGDELKMKATFDKGFFQVDAKKQSVRPASAKKK